MYNKRAVAAFIAGAKWADEHPKEGMVSLDKACDWLLINASDYAISCNGDDDDCTVQLDMIVDFKKAMEE